MDISDRTRACREKLGLSQGKVAKLLGITQPSYQRLEKGDVKNPKQLDRLAEIYQTTPQWIKYGVGSPPTYLKGMLMAEGHAPKFKEWKVIKDWLKVNYNIEALFDIYSFRTDVSTVEQPLRGQGITFISIPNKKNHKQFALEIKNDSMISPTPGIRSFLINDVIVIDPEQPCKDGDYVVALKGKEQEPVFAQYVGYGGEYYLKPLNPQYPNINMNGEILICGVVVTHMKQMI